MEQQVNNNTASGSERMILRLHGIDKEWVRSASGEWVDLAELHQPQPAAEQFDFIPDEPTTTKRWWKFWG